MAERGVPVAGTCDAHRPAMGALIVGMVELHPETSMASMLAEAFRIQSQSMSRVLPHPDAVRTFLRAAGALPTTGSPGLRPGGMPPRIGRDVRDDLELVLEMRHDAHCGDALLSYRDAVAVASLCREHLDAEAMAWLAMTGYSDAKRSRVR